jgi:hypothetical protein
MSILRSSGFGNYIGVSAAAKRWSLISTQARLDGLIGAPLVGTHFGFNLAL